MCRWLFFECEVCPGSNQLKDSVYFISDRLDYPFSNDNQNSLGQYFFAFLAVLHKRYNLRQKPSRLSPYLFICSCPAFNKEYPNGLRKSSHWLHNHSCGVPWLLRADGTNFSYNDVKVRRQRFFDVRVRCDDMTFCFVLFWFDVLGFAAFLKATWCFGVFSTDPNRSARSRSSSIPLSTYLSRRFTIDQGAAMKTTNEQPINLL